jgi:hypothetical protein
MTRRVVLAPQSAVCEPFPAVTNNHRGQVAGIPYDKDVFVMVMAMMARPCAWNNYAGEFGPNGKMNADVAGLIWMWSDENDPDDVGEDWFVQTSFGDGDPNNNNMTYPTAAVARGHAPIGGLTMATEIFNGHRVDLTWPGTGPMTDPVERAALKDFMQALGTEPPFQGWGDVGIDGNPFSGSIIQPEAFIADDTMDPCSNNGQGKRLYAVTCIGGHVVSLYFDWGTCPQISAFPASIPGLAHLRHIWAGGNACGHPNKLVFSCEFGQLANLVALVFCRFPGSGPIEFPEDSCLSGLVSLQEVTFGAYEMNRFPPSFLALPTADDEEGIFDEGSCPNAPDDNVPELAHLEALGSWRERASAFVPGLRSARSGIFGPQQP